MENVIMNSLGYPQSPRAIRLPEARPGPLSQRLLAEVRSRQAPPPPG